MAAFATNAQVIISGLRTRPDLNDKQACVLSFCDETQRYAVKIHETGERIKVRSMNVKSAPQEEHPVPSSSSPTPTPDGAASRETQPSDKASSPRNSAAKEGTTTRLSLPTGQWEARVLIQDGSETSVLLAATEHGSLSGPTCTRSFLSESTSEGVSAEVEGDTLVVFVPAPSAVAPALEDAEEVQSTIAEEALPSIPEEAEAPVEGFPAQEGQAARGEAAVSPVSAAGDSEEEVVDDKENDHDNIAEWEASLGLAKHRGRARGTRGAGWLKPGVKAAGLALKQPRPRTTETSDKGVAVSCNPNLHYHRSRRASQARRRASASAAERRMAAHAKAGAQPSWKAQRHWSSRTVAM